VDTDGGGVSDGEEVNYQHTDPLYWYDDIDAGTRDSDGDGLYDRDETQLWYTDPFNADTDGDGLWDGAELWSYGTSPTHWDTDGDGSSPLTKNQPPPLAKTGHRRNPDRQRELAAGVYANRPRARRDSPLGIWRSPPGSGLDCRASENSCHALQMTEPSWLEAPAWQGGCGSVECSSGAGRRRSEECLELPCLTRREWTDPVAGRRP
jgi:hypothetical protein